MQIIRGTGECEFYCKGCDKSTTQDARKVASDVSANLQLSDSHSLNGVNGLRFSLF